MKKQIVITYAPRIIVAFILLQTLLFKFGIGGEEFLKESQALFGTLSMAIFGTMDNEALIRIGTGILELLASVLILYRPLSVYGAILGVGLMGGAILSHLFFLGIVVKGDGGQLFIMALIVLIASIKVLYDERDKLMGPGK